MWDFTEANWVSEVKGSGVMKVVFVFVGGEEGLGSLGGRPKSLRRRPMAMVVWFSCGC